MVTVVTGLKRIACAILAAAAPVAAADNSTIIEREAPSVEAAAGAVERDGTKLILHLTSGKTQTLIDGPSCFDEEAPRPKGVSCYGYEFNRYDKARHAFVIDQYYYEGGSYIIVDDRSGELTELQSDPSLSLNGDVALELVYGESGYYSGEPRISIWRRRAGKFILEWSKPLVNGGGEASFAILGWRSNEHVDIEASPFWSDEGLSRFSVVRSRSGWQIIGRQK
jgi:hypothetical protein